jgi:hypothetical protein
MCGTAYVLSGKVWVWPEGRRGPGAGLHRQLGSAGIVSVGADRLDSAGTGLSCPPVVHQLDPWRTPLDWVLRRSCTHPYTYPHLEQHGRPGPARRAAASGGVPFTEFRTSLRQPASCSSDCRHSPHKRQCAARFTPFEEFSVFLSRSLCLRNRHSLPSRRDPKARRRCTRLQVETREDRLAPAILVVTDAGDSGPGTLRQKILDANNEGTHCPPRSAL